LKITEEKYFFEKEVFSKPDYEFNFEFDKDLIKEILRHKKSGKVLELGCGEGGISLELARRNFDVTCIDISKTAIELIKKEALKKNVKINVICADLGIYKIKEKYDIIIAKGFFHFLPKKNTLKLILDCQKYTKDEGINIFDVLLEGDPSQGEDSEGYYFKEGELKRIYSEWEIIDYEEYEDFDEEDRANELGFLIAKKIKGI